METPFKRFLPLAGALASLVLFALSAAQYPGGYDWANHTISRLFQPTLSDGAVNPARGLAVIAVLLFCVSIAVVINRVSGRGKSRFQTKTIQIAGIGSMVYAFLIVTPMHDVLVGVALAFFATAMTAVFHMLFFERNFGMLCAGVVCLALTLTNAAMYYGDMLYESLPIVQKVSLAMWVSWLFALHFSEPNGVSPEKPTQ